MFEINLKLNSAQVRNLLMCLSHAAQSAKESCDYWANKADMEYSDVFFEQSQYYLQIFDQIAKAAYSAGYRSYVIGGTEEMPFEDDDKERQYD